MNAAIHRKTACSMNRNRPKQHPPKETGGTFIEACHHPLYQLFFRSYVRRMLRRHFSRITVSGDTAVRKDQALLLIGNHFSWWDGFFAFYLNEKIFKKILHVMMLEEQLQPRKFLSRIGAFSINKQSRSMLNSIAYASSLLKNPLNLLVIFPQGEFQSLYDRPLKFEKGWIKIPERADRPFRFFFYAALVDYFASVKPRLSFYLKEYAHKQGQTVKDIEKAYNDFYDECRRKQKE